MTNVEKLFYKFDELTENYAKEKTSLIYKH